MTRKLDRKKDYSGCASKQTRTVFFFLEGIAAKRLQEMDTETFWQRWRQQDVGQKGRHAEQTDWEAKTAGCETESKACWTQMGCIERERQKTTENYCAWLWVCVCVCVCVCNRVCVIGCGQERNTLSVCRGVGLCPPSLWLQPHLPCILKRQNAEPWTQLLALHQSCRLTLTCCTQKQILTERK